MYSEQVLQKMYENINYNLFNGRLPVVEFSVRVKSKLKNGWNVKKKKEIYEIIVYDYCLFEETQEIYIRMLHQIIHILNMEAGELDTSRNGQYHNKVFRHRAIQYGLITERTESSGHDTVGIRKDILKKIKLKNDRKLLNDAIEKDMDIEMKSMSEKKCGYICPVCKKKAVSGSTMKLICGYCLVDMIRDNL